MNGHVIYKSIASESARNHVAIGNSFIHCLSLFWLIGIILFDKSFAYLRLGPIYITEFTMSSLILYNFRRISLSDFILISVVIFYIVGGILAGNDPFFAIRDMAWLYYLLFIRFFPRNFPNQFIKIVMAVCWFRVFLIFLAPLKIEIIQMMEHKYRDGVVILFLVAVSALSRSKPAFTIGATLLFSLVSILSDYKTLMIVILLLPILFSFRRLVSKIHSRSGLLLLSAIILCVIIKDGINETMIMFVNSLNFLMDLLGIDKKFSTGTAIWRGEIWRQALFKLTHWYDVIFGQFPGYNFMNSKYLGIKSFILVGGEGLGITRTAHNILIQMVMKSGLFGMLVFFWYYFKQVDSKNSVINLMRFLALILAMTADIIEVPSRGPLLFCLFVILEIKFENRNSSIYSSHISTYPGPNNSHVEPAYKISS